MDKRNIFIILSYGLVALLLVFYSYTQVDLGLTLVDKSMWQSIQQWFQHIGYFHRPLSTFLYTIIVGILFLLYGYTFYFVQKGLIAQRTIWISIIILAVIVPFSYPALSYDLFNYMFTAKTILIYRKDPYLIPPLQFAGIDPWLGFMHWTHNTSAYPPLWLILSVPLFLFGFGYFLLTMWSFKFFLAFCYVVILYVIKRLLEKEHRSSIAIALALTFVGLNPLVIIESLVSSHNDIAMIALGCVALYYAGKKKWIYASVFFISSILVKGMTLAMAPALFCKKRNVCIAVLMSLALILFCVIQKREVLPWYMLWVIPFFGLLPITFDLFVVWIGISLGFLLYYVPFLYFGHWNTPVPEIKLWAIIIPIACSVCFVLVRKLLCVRKR